MAEGDLIFEATQTPHPTSSPPLPRAHLNDGPIHPLHRLGQEKILSRPVTASQMRSQDRDVDPKAVRETCDHW